MQATNSTYELIRNVIGTSISLLAFVALIFHAILVLSNDSVTFARAYSPTDDSYYRFSHSPHGGYSFEIGRVEEGTNGWNDERLVTGTFRGPASLFGSTAFQTVGADAQGIPNAKATEYIANSHFVTLFILFLLALILACTPVLKGAVYRLGVLISRTILADPDQSRGFSVTLVEKPIRDGNDELGSSE